MSDWYFGYGSNMDPRTFLGRRRMRPLEVRIGEVRGWELVFDLGVGEGERGVANLTRAEDARVWGVLYRISDAQFDWLDRTEGVHRGAYTRVGVPVRTPGGVVIDGVTYVSERRRADRKPSRRYLGLLLAGARHHLLPDAYIRELRGIDLAIDEREAKQGELF